MKRIHWATLALALSLTGIAMGQTPPQPASLDEQVACLLKGPLRVTAKDRRAAKEAWRDVETASGRQRVSVADGYRLMLGLQGPEPLVNLKIERSVPGQFAADRAAVLAQMTYIGDRRAAAAEPLDISVQDGVELMGLHNPAVEGPGPVSMMSLLHEPTQTVLTAYVLSQSPGKRELTTPAAYASLRAQLVDHWVACLAPR